MIRIYGWGAAIAGTVLLFIWALTGSFPWSWTVTLAALFCAGMERTDLEAARRENHFMHEELDRLSIDKGAAKNAAR